MNFYMLVDGEAITLVDTGFYGYLRYRDDWLSLTSRDINDIKAVVLTHGHADHTGFAGYLAGRGVPVYVHQDAANKISPGRWQIPPKRIWQNIWRPSILGLLGEAITDSVLTQPPVRNAHAFSDGRELDVPGCLRATHVPGHSAGNCTLYHAGLDQMFTGDTLMTVDPIGYARESWRRLFVNVVVKQGVVDWQFVNVEVGCGFSDRAELSLRRVGVVRSPKTPRLSNARAFPGSGAPMFPTCCPGF